MLHVSTRVALAQATREKSSTEQTPIAGENSTAKKYSPARFFLFWSQALTSRSFLATKPQPILRSIRKLLSWKGQFPRLGLCVLSPIWSAQNPGGRSHPQADVLVFPIHWSSESECFQGPWCTYNMLSNHFCDMSIILGYSMGCRNFSA